MPRKNAQDIEYTLAWVKDVECLFSEERIDPKTVPEGFYKYDIRHSDEDWSQPCTLEKQVGVNYYGSILTLQELDMGADDYIDIHGEGQFIDSGDVATIDEFREDDPPEKRRRKPSTMRVLVVEPLKQPYMKTIPHTLEGMQAVVGGSIQAVNPYGDPVAIICNDDGKLLDLPPNRILRDRYGTPCDYIVGTFFVCGVGEEDFESIPHDMEQKYTKLFAGEMLRPAPSRRRSGKTHQPER